MKYIDSDKLKAEIEKKKEYALEHYHNQGDIQSAYNICCEILSSIDSLQQEHPGADLEEEVKSYIKDNFTITDEIAQIPEEDRMYSMRRDDMVAFAKYFYKLGKERKKD